MRTGETHVPIPNTIVKPRTADDTMLETAWESRWMPEPIYGSGNRFHIIMKYCTLKTAHWKREIIFF